MKKFLKELEYWFDYHIAYFLFNGNKRDQYYEYMEKKWGNKNEKTK